VKEREKTKAGSILRVPAAHVESLVAEALGKLSLGRAASQTDIRNLIDRVVIGRATIRIRLSEVAEENDSARILTVPWTRPSPFRKREVIQAANNATIHACPPFCRSLPILRVTTSIGYAANGAAIWAANRLPISPAGYS
jgi:hypothetical protein